MPRPHVPLIEFPPELFCLHFFISSSILEIFLPLNFRSFCEQLGLVSIQRVKQEHVPCDADQWEHIMDGISDRTNTPCMWDVIRAVAAFSNYSNFQGFSCHVY